MVAGRKKKGGREGKLKGKPGEKKKKKREQSESLICITCAVT